MKAEIIQNDEQLKDHFTKESPTDNEKITYQNKMIELIKKLSNWSIARYLHYLAIFVQIFNLLWIGFIAIGLTIDRSSKNYKDSSEFKLALMYCSLAGLVSYLWALMRVAFNLQKPIYFPEISNPVADVVIIASFITITLVIVIALIMWIGDKLSIFISIVVFLAGGVGVFSVIKFQNLLVAVFGRNAGTVPYWTILLGIGALAILIFLARRISANPSNEAM